MYKDRLIEKLDKATDKAVIVALSNNIPLRISNKSALIGNLRIEKNERGFFNIVSFNGNIIFENISLFDIAVIIAQKHANGETSAIKRIISLDEKYSKYHLDMLHYLHCLKSAKRNGDIERMAILEDKFQMAEIMAKHIRSSLLTFKKTKYALD